jgi:predicted transcriptional regulator of viral defense system
MARQLEFIDTLVAEGREEFTFGEAKRALGGTSASVANILRGLAEKGLVDRFTRGHYAIRPLGSLGTSAVTDNLSLAVGAAFQGRPHRIAYLTALAELGVLSHPVRPVFVACTHQVRLSGIGPRALRVVVERPQTIHLEAEPVGRSWRSTLERALFECAMRIDLAGSAERLAEALRASVTEIDPAKISQLASVFGPRGQAAERRLVSMARALDLPLDLDPDVGRRRPVIGLDPRDDRVEWIDPDLRVAWNTTADEMRAVVRN